MSTKSALKRKLRRTVIETLWLDDVSGPAQDVIDRLTNLIDQHPGKTVNLDWDIDDYDGTTLSIYIEEPETDEEYAQRLDRFRNQLRVVYAEKMAHEREEYERLKRKFES